MKRILWLVVLLAAFCSSALAERPLMFGEFWNNVAYYETNLDRKNFAALLAHYEGKIGYYLFGSPVQAYGVYYGTWSQAADYWDNSLFYGLGLRLKPWESYKGAGWQDEWIRDVKVFTEVLQSKYFMNAASAEAAGLSVNDTVYGLELYHEWNLDQADTSLPWGELWSKLMYRNTNFGWEPFNTYVLYFQPKLGIHLPGGVEPYLRADLTYSGKSGPSYSYLNVADYGVGLRIEPWRRLYEDNDFVRKFKMFVEVVGVSFLKDKPTDPNKQVSTDVRFGIDFSYGR